MKKLSWIWLFASVLINRAAEPVSFTRDIAPVLVAKCLACHNVEKAKGQYRLHTFEALMKAGSSGSAPLIPGKPADSLLFQLITTHDEDERMPQKDEALAPEQIASIRSWIEQGANYDGGDSKAALALLAPPEHRRPPTAYPVAWPVTALAFDPTGRELAASGYHEITVWDASSGKLTRRIGDIAERVFDLVFSPDGAWMACAAGTPGKFGELKLIAVTNGNASRTLAIGSDAMLCVAFSPDGQKLAAGGADNTIRIWNLESGQPPLIVEQHADWVLALAFSPDGAHLASGSRDKTARVFRTQSGELEETYTGHADFVTAIAWPDDKSVLTAARTRTAHRWNLKDVKKTAEFSGWENDITRLIVSGTNVFSVSLDRRLRVHDLASKAVVRTHEPHHDAVHSLAFHPSARRLVSGSHDGEVRVWNSDSGDPVVKFVAAPGFTGKLSRSE